MQWNGFRVRWSLGDGTSCILVTTTLTILSSQVGGQSGVRRTILSPGQSFYNQSDRGSFGDSLLELDWSVGRIMETLDSLKVSKKNV